MIKYFRKIRQNLIIENKTGKYFKYAIGEIVLVVIGILIALSINNCNEKRVSNFVEQKILQAVLDDVNSDILTMKYMILNDSLLIESNKKLIGILKNEQSEYSDNYAGMFGEMNRYDIFYAKKMGYEALKAQGLTIIQNDELKAVIVNLYDYLYPSVNGIVNLKEQHYLNSNIIFNKYLETNIEDQYVLLRTPNDFNELKTSKEFINVLTNITAEYMIYIKINRDILENMQSASAQIVKELEK
jgi:hypothetical protein